jgi:DNA invertase Pin-like site-specific DNA recombinase
LLNIVSRLEAKQVQFVVLDQQIDTSTATGRLMLSLLGAIAEFENDLRKDRQLQGIAVAKRNGVKFGRKAALTASQIAELRVLRAEGVKIVDLMSRFKISKASAYRALATD